MQRYQFPLETKSIICTKIITINLKLERLNEKMDGGRQLLALFRQVLDSTLRMNTKINVEQGWKVCITI